MAGEYVEFNNNTQPAVNDYNLNRMQQLIKQDIGGAISGDTLPIGTIITFTSDTIPENWLLCDGSAISRTDYQDLFNIIGITYGQGDSFSTFNLPNLQGKLTVGKNSNDTDFNTLGKTGGEKNHTLTIDEIPAHTHTATQINNITTTNVVSGAGIIMSDNPTQRNTSSAGGGESHNNLQPYVVINYIIKAKQSAPITSTVIDNLNSTSAIDALSANQGKVLKDLLNGTILYESNSGTNATIPLNTNPLNFKKLEIDFITSTSQTTHYSKSTIPIYSSTTQTYNLTSNYFGSSYMYTYETFISINTDNIVFNTNRTYQRSVGSPSNLVRTEDSPIKILKIVGLNY